MVPLDSNPTALPLPASDNDLSEKPASIRKLAGFFERVKHSKTLLHNKLLLADPSYAVFIGSQLVACKVLLQDFFRFQQDLITHSICELTAALSRIGVFSNNMHQTVCDFPGLLAIGHRFENRDQVVHEITNTTVLDILPKHRGLLVQTGPAQGALRIFHGSEDNVRRGFLAVARAVTSAGKDGRQRHAMLYGFTRIACAHLARLHA